MQTVAIVFPCMLQKPSVAIVVDKRKLAMEKVLFKYDGNIETELVERVLSCLVTEGKATTWQDLAGLEEVKKKLQVSIQSYTFY